MSTCKKPGAFPVGEKTRKTRDAFRKRGPAKNNRNPRGNGGREIGRDQALAHNISTSEPCAHYSRNRFYSSSLFLWQRDIQNIPSKRPFV